VKKDQDEIAAGKPKAKAQVSLIPALGAGPGPTPDRTWFVDKWTKLTATGGLSFLLVENPVVQELLDDLAPGLWDSFQPRMTRKTISAYTPVLAQAVSDEIGKLLEGVSWVSISSDEWASRKSSLPFITVVVYFTIGGVGCVRLLDVIPLFSGGTSKQTALEIFKCLRRYNIMHKVASLTTDGANAQMAVTNIWDSISNNARMEGEQAADQNENWMTDRDWTGAVGTVSFNMWY